VNQRQISFENKDSLELNTRNCDIIMLQRTAVALSKQGKRTIVRDPRKRQVPSVVPPQVTSPQQIQERRQPFAFEPTTQNQQSVGSTMGSYMLAGVGMSIGFSIVGAVFGGF
jgi:hypothetical protein